MQNFNFLEKELLDIIFMGRNQEYGAYVLRKTYPQQIKNAALLTGAILLSLLVIYFASGGEKHEGIMAPTYEPPAVLTHVVLPIKNEGKAGQVAPKEPVQNKRNPYDIVEHTVPVQPPIEKPIERVPPVIAVGPGTADGPISAPGLGGTKTDGTGVPTDGGTGATITKTAVPSKPAPPMVTAQVMPMFPGGEDAMMAYLQSHMRYPKFAERTGVSGKVYVEFVVGANGKIRDVHLLNSIGGGCDEEAMRVIKSMPAWKPGMQDGNKVAVSFRIPVQFEL